MALQAQRRVHALRSAHAITCHLVRKRRRLHMPSRCASGLQLTLQDLPPSALEQFGPILRIAVQRDDATYNKQDTAMTLLYTGRATNPVLVWAITLKADLIHCLSAKGTAHVTGALVDRSS